MGGQKPRCLRNRKCITTKETVQGRREQTCDTPNSEAVSLLPSHTHTHFRLFFQFGCVGFRCCSGFFLVAGGRDHSPAAVLRLLIGVASLLAEHGLQVFRLQSCDMQAQYLWPVGSIECRLSSCAWAQLLHSTWNLPRPEITPMSHALEGGFLSTVPPQKSHKLLIVENNVDSKLSEERIAAIQSTK